VGKRIAIRICQFTKILYNTNPSNENAVAYAYAPIEKKFVLPTYPSLEINVVILF
jgi:hypothetical protein